MQTCFAANAIAHAHAHAHDDADACAHARDDCPGTDTALTYNLGMYSLLMQAASAFIP